MRPLHPLAMPMECQNVDNSSSDVKCCCNDVEVDDAVVCDYA